MLWPMLAIALGFLGVAVLSVLALRVWLEVRRLSGQVADASRRITDASGDLERAAADLARAGNAVRP
ncbi:hypothetical protein OHU17_28130 [Streptomyces goshikiensis]|uniref:Uncharacterized protein n=1 Tax=Streptomyces goshikiensis TaxID=1942 RepID=A0ABZ1RTF5_9ACTN|nr:MULTISPECIES: hypothetical protein [Streptomyces]AKL65429.1 membrane protein [Streptomyces sp. Mg1]AYV26885.1 hypothetical protein EES41_09140 [Streptomyces sp. ADI95-16]EDX24884.1 hypothetical protein SSAG_04675 [Streptomyces sp. Mg1]MBP0933458.1 hypothetical protein [Streptomyces sp. KCTC 0041BP]MBT1188146.1 hypothetical protein [Streptomyces sp. CJ_13]